MTEYIFIQRFLGSLIKNQYSNLNALPDGTFSNENPSMKNANLSLIHKEHVTLSKLLSTRFRLAGSCFKKQPDLSNELRGQV